MDLRTVGPPTAALRTAITVMNSDAGAALCPFFGKCDGILIVNAARGTQEFYPNTNRTPAALCDLIVRAKPDRLVCGYVSELERQRLREAGIDVRLGSCTCTVDELSACFCDLPEA